MSNKQLFNSNRGSFVKAADTTNNAGGKAYSLSDKAALAQYAATGCLNNTFYTTAQDQLTEVLKLANKVEPLFLAKLAIYSRQHGLLKDMPALLLAVLATKDTNLLKLTFPKVIDNPKMVRNFVQILRSGQVGRKSLGTAPKKLVQNYLESLSDLQLFKADIGNSPSLPDILKMVHPKPTDESRSNMYAYLLDKKHSEKLLPEAVQAFELFKKDTSNPIPDVPFQMLTALNLTKDHWKSIAKNATWNQTRMNLNTFARHGVFEDIALVNHIMRKLQDPEQVKKSKVLPYNLFTAFQNIDDSVPMGIKIALQQAADLSLGNIPEIDGKVYVCPDVSGSMSSPITGARAGVITKTRCIDVAALIASSFLRKNPANTVVLPFDTKVHTTNFNPLDSVMTNAQTLARFGGGGTDCSLPLAKLNKENAKGDLVIYISDNESHNDRGYGHRTGLMAEWTKFKNRNPNAKLVCIDIQPYATSQVPDGDNRLNIGGFSDSVYNIIDVFYKLGNDKDLWVRAIEQMDV